MCNQSTRCYDFQEDVFEVEILKSVFFYLIAVCAVRTSFAKRRQMPELSIGRICFPQFSPRGYF